MTSFAPKIFVQCDLHPASKKRQLIQISPAGASAVRASENVQLALIINRSRAFEQVIDKLCTIPLFPKKWLESKLSFFANIAKLLLNEVS